MLRSRFVWYCNWWMRIPLLYINSRVVRKHIVFFKVQQVVNYFTNGKVRSPTNCRCWRIANAVSALPFTAAWAPKLTPGGRVYIAAWMGLWPLGYIANLWTCVIRVVLVALSCTPGYTPSRTPWNNVYNFCFVVRLWTYIWRRLNMPHAIQYA